MHRVVPIVFLTLVAAVLPAQTSERPSPTDVPSIGVIVYAEGNDVTILRAGA
ncbi:MAG: hypothetical protein ACOC0O_01740 [Spirochaetota bacterium]